MQKRIGELYRKASFDDNVASEQEMVEKFAELLIKECAETFAKAWYEQGMDIRGGDIIKFMTLLTKHFDIKE